MTNFYDCGDVVRLSADFSDIGGTLADPSAITLRVKQPDATVAVYTYPSDVMRDGAGAYHYDLSISEPGDWYYRFEGSGAVQAASESLFHVYKSNVI
ncbi:MAG TPA: hypothetical protein VMV79_04770 [Alphaproteobacteria bacterium]|nr:hypothetical protein [Alphaproteobacteria bacterium]